MRSRVGVLTALVVLVLVLVVVSLGPGAPDPPFSVGSSEPAGYRGIALLLTGAGVEVRSVRAADLADGSSRGGPGRGEALVVPVAAYLTAAESDLLDAAARRGATVVLSGTSEPFRELDDRVLQREPAVEVRRGRCDIPGLGGLEAIDDVDGFGVEAAGADGPVADGLPTVCFTDAGVYGPGRAGVVARAVGAGRVVELSSPYLWANARLQPDKEDGGEPLDNGPLAVALLGASPVVTFVEAVPSRGALVDGELGPLDLVPRGVQLALAQCVGAFVLYAWWRARRLGRPVREEMPVEVSGSELVEAVGGLLRRHGSPAAAARALQAELARELSARFGLPARGDTAALAALAGLVARRTGRDPDEVAALLGGTPVRTAGDLVRFANTIDSIRTEVLDGQPAP
jgi:hypothetical protein